MARNSEKHFVGLNRVFLNEQWDREKEKKRPHLDTLTTAADVRKWIPSIKDELDYCLRQLGGARKHEYPPAKLAEFEERVKRLEKQHKLFVKKVRELDSSQVGIPWEPRGYVSKRKQEKESEDKNEGEGPKRKQKKKIVLNILKKEKEEGDGNGDEEEGEGSTNSWFDWIFFDVKCEIDTFLSSFYFKKNFEPFFV